MLVVCVLNVMMRLYGVESRVELGGVEMLGGEAHFDDEVCAQPHVLSPVVEYAHRKL